MELVNLSHSEVKYSINDDGTLIINIKNKLIFKISWGEIRSLDMIISEQQSEALGIAQKMIEKLKKGVDTSRSQDIPQITSKEDRDSLFTTKQVERFERFLHSYLNKDNNVEVFTVQEIETVIGSSFLLPELEEEFGEKYSFKDLNNDQISIMLKKESL